MEAIIWKNNDGSIARIERKTYDNTQGVGRGIDVLLTDRTNNNAVANTLENVIGFNFTVLAGSVYKFRFYITYTAAAATTGCRWTISGPAFTFLLYRSEYTLTATARTVNEGLTGYDLPAASNASSLVNGNIAIIEGVIKPSANGVVVCRYASEIAGSAIVAKGQMTYCEYEEIV